MAKQPDDLPPRVESADASEADEKALDASWKNLNLPAAKPWSEADSDE